MFTGIIEEVGEINNITQNSLGLDIEILANSILDDLKLGDSVSINGCCQTVTAISNTTFTVQAVFETVNKTTFSELKAKQKVNLERALTLTTRLGGHLVTGHVDSIGKILNIQKKGNSFIFEISIPKEIKKYLIYKGSITIQGISLTICELNQNTFKVSVIPHTYTNTTLSNFKVGDNINLESDVLAKYIEKLMIKEDNTNSNITLEFLRENGF